MAPGRLVAGINTFMATHQWNHNEFYHRWILRRLPPTVSRALDVGCGTGDLARLLAGRSAHVDGIDTDLTMIDHARRLTPVPGRTTFSVASVMDLPADPTYDAITAVAVLHHVPFAAALRRLTGALAPGGTLVIVGCYRDEGKVDRLLHTTAVPVNLAFGLGRGAAVPPVSMSAPVAVPTMTLAAIRDSAEQVVPGFRLRRGLFWRYLLTYAAGPAAGTPRR